MKIALAVLAALALLVGCASAVQRVSPVSKLEAKQICVVRNAAVRQTFHDALELALGKRGYQVRTVPDGSTPAACPLVAQYVAHWRWDLALYMSYAELKVFHDQKQIGTALYDATAVLGTSKFINGEEKLNELVGQLFPY